MEGFAGNCISALSGVRYELNNLLREWPVFREMVLDFLRTGCFYARGRTGGDDRLNKNIKIYINIYIEKRGKNIGKCGF